MFLAAEIQGVSVLLGVAQPPSVRDALPPTLLYLWAFLLAAGGATALLGLFWRGDAFNALEIFRAGLIALAGGTAVYSCSALLLGPRGLAVAIFNGFFAVACLVRARQVRRGSRRAREIGG